MKAELALIISLVSEDDWKQVKASTQKTQFRNLDGFEVSLALAFSLKPKDWATLKEMKEQGLQVGLRLPNVHVPLGERAELAWREIILLFPFSWIFREGGWNEEPRPNHRFITRALNPLYKSESIMDSAKHPHGLGEQMIRIDGAHVSRWIRRYGESEIRSAQFILDKLIRSFSLELLVLSYSGRWKEIHLFRKWWLRPTFISSV